MKQTRIWIFLIGLLVILSILALFLIQLLKQSGDKVEVYQNGVLLYSLPLDEDQTLQITSENGGFNVVTIEHGEVWVSEASCPDQVCVHHGPTHETSDPIVCLPNKLVVQVTRAHGESLDGVTQ